MHAALVVVECSRSWVIIWTRGAKPFWCSNSLSRTLPSIRGKARGAKPFIALAT
jgi:hypothetical protein